MRFRATVTCKYTPEERIILFSCVTPEKKNELDLHFANAILNDGIAFTTGSSPNWNAFWKCAFGGSWKPQYRDRISGEFLDKSYNGSEAMSPKRYQMYLPYVCRVMASRTQTLDHCQLNEEEPLCRLSFIPSDSTEEKKARLTWTLQYLVQYAMDLLGSKMKESYGCLCHALSNFVKDLGKEQHVRNTLTKTIKLAQFFRNTH
eukprot:IDg1433t1